MVPITDHHSALPAITAPRAPQGRQYNRHQQRYGHAGRSNSPRAVDLVGRATSGDYERVS